MGFWRNESTDTFDPNGAGAVQLDCALDALKKGEGAMIAPALATLFQRLPGYLEGGKAAPKLQERWMVQEVSWRARVLNARFVIAGTDRPILNSIVGGGLGLWIEANGHIAAELSLYYHRLVCTNGMIRRVEAVGRFDASSLDEWTAQLEERLPVIMQGISTGMDTLSRSAQIRLGLLRPVIPVVLDYLEVKEPDRRLILDAFAVEPGDTLWHFINAFSRAANLVMLAHGVPPEQALQKRHQLQRASMGICEEVLEQFGQGKSLFEVAGSLRGLLSF